MCTCRLGYTLSSNVMIKLTALVFATNMSSSAVKDVIQGNFVVKYADFLLITKNR